MLTHRLRGNRDDLTALHWSNLLVVEQGFSSAPPIHKIKRPAGACLFYGGDEGIRTLDTLAGIPHFQCGALDQLCDISWCSNIFYSADKSAVSSVSDGSTGFSINVSSSSASISRNFGSSVVVISKDSSSFGVIGDSL